MLIVETPATRQPERTYVLSTVLQRFLGLSFETRVGHGPDVLLYEAGAPDRHIRIVDTFFATQDGNWLAPGFEQALAQPSGGAWLTRRGAGEEGIPALFGRVQPGRNPVRHGEGTVEIDVDLFGSIFFLLTRYEEIATPTRDRFDRFPAAASLLARLGALHRPVADEYVEVLWEAIEHLWPGMRRRQRAFAVLPSHDVDLPLKHGFSPLPRTALAAARDWAVSGRAAALERLRAWHAVRQGRAEEDPYNTFDYLMAQSERRGLRSAFYFLAGHTCRLDAMYRIEHPWIQALIGRLAARGHEIGLHTSFNTYRDAAQTLREFQALKQVCASQGVAQSEWGGRQHYLRWANPSTWLNWENAGLDYDSTLGFADEIGFRCGTCHEYTAFDVRSSRPLKLLVRPLLVMDATLLTNCGADLGGDAFNRVREVRSRCSQVEGSFTLLWHNSNLLTNIQRDFYESFLGN